MAFATNPPAAAASCGGRVRITGRWKAVIAMLVGMFAKSALRLNQRSARR